MNWRMDIYQFQEVMADFCRNRARCLSRTALWWLVFSTLASVWWIQKKFGVPSFNQFLYHFEFGCQGLLTAEYYVLKSFIISNVLLPVLPAWALGSGMIKATRKLGFVAPVACLLLAFACLLNQVSFWHYLRIRNGYDYFSFHYKDPRTVSLTAKSPRNLVLIYVESLDATYGDAHLFGRDLLHNLEAPAVHGQSFVRYNQAPGTGWTMAAMVSTQCGVPLEAVTLYDGNDQGGKLKHYLPGGVCLGDVLDAFGYRNIFMGGAPLDFAGKGKFLKDHHYENVYGREDWIAEGEKVDEHGWGLHDDDLFHHARTELDALEASGGRFNLTLLTLDSHYSGIESLSNYCARRGAQNFTDLIECTADQTAEFIDYIRQKGYLENLDVVVLGDHLAMGNPVIDRLRSVPERHIFNLFVSKAPPRKTREDILHFDLFPTILDLIGIHVQKGRLALGYSAFAASSPRPEVGRLEEMRDNLMHPSPLYFHLWTQTNAPPLRLVRRALPSGAGPRKAYTRSPSLKLASTPKIQVTN
jgi:phosphoglycerol transferase